MIYQAQGLKGIIVKKTVIINKNNNVIFMIKGGVNMAKEERDILYPEQENTPEETIEVEIEAEEEEAMEDHLGYHNFYGF